MLWRFTVARDKIVLSCRQHLRLIITLRGTSEAGLTRYSAEKKYIESSTVSSGNECRDATDTNMRPIQYENNCRSFVKKC